jgi:hypothetical protein
MSQQASILVLPPALLIIGLGLMGLGWIWSSVIPSTVYWGPEQAEEYTRAQADLHAKTHAAKHRSADYDEHQFAAARQRFEQIRGQLDAARSAQASIGTYLATAGILLVLVGIGIHLANQQPG